MTSTRTMLTPNINFQTKKSLHFGYIPFKYELKNGSFMKNICVYLRFELIIQLFMEHESWLY